MNLVVPILIVAAMLAAWLVAAHSPEGEKGERGFNCCRKCKGCWCWRCPWRMA